VLQQLLLDVQGVGADVVGARAREAGGGVGGGVAGGGGLGRAAGGLGRGEGDERGWGRWEDACLCAVHVVLARLEGVGVAAAGGASCATTVCVMLAAGARTLSR